MTVLESFFLMVFIPVQLTIIILLLYRIANANHTQTPQGRTFQYPPKSQGPGANLKYQSIDPSEELCEE